MCKRISVLAVLAVLAVSLTVRAADPQTKMGPIKSVDANAKTFVLDLPARPLTFTVDDKTVITLDGKASTFADAIKVDLKASVTYTRGGDTRLAVKVEVTSAAPAK